jgi:hypothetical protein
MSTEPTIDVRALADAVRHGELSAERREHLVTLLHSVATAVRLGTKGPGDLPSQRHGWGAGIPARLLAAGHQHLHGAGPNSRI